MLGWEADLRLLTRAGATVTRVGGCCGLAGNFGVEQGHYEVSVAIAEHTCSPPYDGRGRGPSCSLTGSRAAPSSTTSRASAHCTSRSSWRATNRFDPGTGSR